MNLFTDNLNLPSFVELLSASRSVLLPLCLPASLFKNVQWFSTAFRIKSELFSLIFKSFHNLLSLSIFPCLPIPPSHTLHGKRNMYINCELEIGGNRGSLDQIESLSINS